MLCPKNVQVPIIDKNTNPYQLTTKLILSRFVSLLKIITYKINKLKMRRALQIFNIELKKPICQSNRFELSDNISFDCIGKIECHRNRILTMRMESYSLN